MRTKPNYVLATIFIIFTSMEDDGSMPRAGSRRDADRQLFPMLLCGSLYGTILRRVLDAPRHARSE